MASHVAPTPIHPGRVRILRPGSASTKSKPGPVIYWMFRDQRVNDNWALLHAANLASSLSAPFAVAFSLFPPPFFLHARARHVNFLLRGLKRLETTLSSYNVPFFFFKSYPKDSIPNLVDRLGASSLVVDFSPLRQFRSELDEIVERIGSHVAIHQVDAHNVVPVWVASDKLEYSARTIRSKINKLLPEFLVDFPELSKQTVEWVGEKPPKIEWDALIDEVNREACDVAEIDWCVPGEDAAKETLLGIKEGFLTKRIKGYHSDRNDPTKPRGLSGLSPYLHFGQISAQRCALEARSRRNVSPQSVDAFLEELIVRRELADNFCYYQLKYDSLDGAWEWARKTLNDHANDKREHIYTREQLDKGKTHDPLWNASQMEMVCYGKMHGFMRMYWAKKILEWTSGPEEALSIATCLNDKYEIDGRDPSGYVGCMWSICGVHDQGWKERPVFGKIRYMNYEGCKRKFNVDAYISYVNKLVSQTKKRKPEGPLDKLLSKKEKK
ncbi:hypothetical protein LUZ63_013332 [Rhynchospora breviuscula]|uniref:Deoxyribodipyrimidine photo-lyase n=1 Tax=Rhynchospora breviuscula TaxID=2022672 RepID=A0A9Q0C8C1_9POAL|nr:hypothetical protein LUZ63_013332 [Rhynchospora breviuscula]